MDILTPVKRCPGLFIRTREKSETYIYRGSPRCKEIHGDKILIGQVSDFESSKKAYEVCQGKEESAEVPNAKMIKGLTCDKMLDLYLKNEERRLTVLKKITEGTYNEKKWIIEKYLRPEFKDLSPEELERCRNQWNDFVDQYKDLDLTNPRKVFKNFLTWAYEEEYINRFPKELVIPDKEWREGKDLGIDLLWEMHQVADTEDLKDFIAISATTGMRKMGVLGLKRSEIVDHGNGLRTIPNKEKDSRTKHKDTIPVSGAVWEILQRRILKYPDSPWIFPKPDSPSSHRNPGSLSSAWKRMIEHLGLEDVRIHDIRTTVENELSRKDISSRLKSKYLVHSAEVAKKHYEKASLEELRSVANAIDIVNYMPKRM